MTRRKNRTKKMNELEKIQIEYEVKNNYALNPSDTFSLDDYVYIYNNPKKFVDFALTNKYYKRLDKFSFGRILTRPKKVDTTTVETQIMKGLKEIRYRKMARSSTNYIYMKMDSAQFYIFKRNELKMLFYVLLFNVDLDCLSHLLKTRNKNKVIILSTHKYDMETGVYYIPASSLILLQDRFRKDYKEYMKDLGKYKPQLDSIFEIVQKTKEEII